MDARVINAFIAGVKIALSFNGNEPQNRQAVISNTKKFALDSSGIISLSGEVNGMVAVTLTTATVNEMTTKMVGQKIQVADMIRKVIDRIVDAVKPDMKTLNIRCAVSSVVLINDLNKNIPAPRIQVPFVSSFGDIALEFYARKKSSTAFFKPVGTAVTATNN